MWVAVVLGLLVAEGIVGHPERRLAGPVLQALLTFVIATGFFFWTMHFLLDGRVPWHRFVRPALLTAVLWVALGVFSSLFFSTTVVDDSKTYGTIGVVFTFLTWFILIGSVVVLGAACGAVWEVRGGRGVFAVDSSGPNSQAQVDGDRGPGSRQIPPG
jgi:membrane protein